MMVSTKSENSLVTEAHPLDRRVSDKIKPHLVFLGLLLATVILFWSPLRAVVALGIDDYRYSQIGAAPFLCGFLMYLDRDRIFSAARFSPGIGIPLFSLATLSYF